MVTPTPSGYVPVRAGRSLGLPSLGMKEGCSGENVLERER